MRAEGMSHSVRTSRLLKWKVSEEIPSVNHRLTVVRHIAKVQSSFGMPSSWT